MAFANKNDTVAGRQPVPTASDMAIVAPRFEQVCVAADSTLNNVGVIGILPAGCVPCLPMVVGNTALGGSAAISVGLLNAAGNDLSTAADDGGAVWAAGVAVGAAPAVVQVSPTAALMAVKPVGHDRKIAVKFTTAGSAGGTLHITVPMRASK